jgi:hypothetical protein
MKIGLVALENDLSNAGPGGGDAAIAGRPGRAAAVLAAIDEARKLSVEFLLFPGFTALEPQGGAEAPVVTALRKATISAVYERVDPAGTGTKSPHKLSGGDEHSTHRRFYSFDAGLGSERPFSAQVVESNGMASSKAGWARLKALSSELMRGGTRRFSLQAVDVALLVCGENNYLYQPRGGYMQTRCGLPDRFDYDVVLNPQHSVVTRREVRERQRWLSAQAPGQLAVSCTNYRPDQYGHKWTMHAAQGNVTVLSGKSAGLHRDRGYILGIVQR